LSIPYETIDSRVQQNGFAQESLMLADSVVDHCKRINNQKQVLAIYFIWLVPYSKYWRFNLRYKQVFESLQIRERHG